MSTEEVKYKVCQSIGLYVKVCRGKDKKPKKGKSNNQSAKFIGNKKMTIVHIVADDSEILEMTTREDITWLDYTCVQPENTTTYSPQGYSKAQKIHKTESTSIHKGRNVPNILEG